MAEESGISILFGLTVVFCFFCRGREVGIGDMEWDIFWFVWGRGCFVAATLASSSSDDVGDDDVRRVIFWGMGSKWKPFIANRDADDRVFVINWDHNCFVVDVDDVRGLSWSPSGPVVLNIEMSALDKGSEEVELIVVGMHLDEDDAVVGAQGEDSRGSESCAGEFMID